MQSFAKDGTSPFPKIQSLLSSYHKNSTLNLSLERSLCRDTGWCVQAIRPQMIGRIKAPSLMGEGDKKDSENKRERDLPIKKRANTKIGNNMDSDNEMMTEPRRD